MMGRTLLALALLVPLTASAQDPDYVSNEEAKKVMADAATDEKKKKPDGWQLSLQVGLNVSLSDSQGVPGIENGTTYQIGGAIKGNARLISGDHEWRNSLDITHTRTSAPPLDEFIKSADDLTLKSMYLYHIPSIPWLGPFARFRLSTALFPGELLLAADTPYQVDGAVDADGNPVLTTLPGRTALDLTGAFEPLLMRESIGVFVNPLDGDALNLTVSVGAGAQEVITQGGQVVADNPDTPFIEINSLQDSTQIGLEVEITAEGAFTETLTYGLTVNTLTPFYSDPEKSAADPETGETLEGPVDLTNIDIGGKLGVKLAKWASLDYVLSAKYLPLIVPEWQVTNSVLLNASFNLL